MSNDTQDRVEAIFYADGWRGPGFIEGLEAKIAAAQAEAERLQEALNAAAKATRFAEREQDRAELVASLGAEQWVEVDDDLEGGQVNGGGVEIEPTSYREWFTEERETHHRRVVTLCGPWLDGSVKATRS